jgi:hypothetical protein
LLEDKRRKTYENGFRFRPVDRKIIDGCRNVWRGWRIEAEAFGRCERLMNFLADRVCGGDLARLNELLQRLAHLFRYPEQRPHVAVALVGDRLARELLRSLLKRIIHPDHFLTDDRKFFGRTTLRYVQSVAVWIEDAEWSTSPAKAAQLRSSISNGETVWLASDQSIHESYARFFVSLPNDAVIRDDQKFAAYHIAKSPMHELRAIIDELEANRGYAAFLWELAQVNLASFSPYQ